jgi:hypothetical protein
MPTYNWECGVCGKEHEEYLAIYEYNRNPPKPVCCDSPMGRTFSYSPSEARDNPLAGDRQFDGLRAPDGTDISSRDKHRRYLRKTGLAMADDFKESWAKAKKDRDLRSAGMHPEQKAERIRNLRDAYEHSRDKSRYYR